MPYFQNKRKSIVFKDNSDSSIDNIKNSDNKRRKLDQNDDAISNQISTEEDIIDEDVKDIEKESVLKEKYESIDYVNTKMKTYNGYKYEKGKHVIVRLDNKETVYQINSIKVFGNNTICQFIPF